MMDHALRLGLEAVSEHRRKIARLIERRSITTAEAVALLFGVGINSEDRAEWLLRILPSVRPKDFWPVFLDVWPSCDDTRHLNSSFVWLLRSKPTGGCRDYLSGPSRTFYDSLPALIEVYRGSSRDFVRGLSWSTDMKVAERFAAGHRGIPVRDACVATALIRKANIFAVLTDRQESEVVVDPKRLLKVKTRKFPAEAQV